MQIKCILGYHNWDGCKCTKCGQTRDEQHELSKDCEKCSVCEKSILNRHKWDGCKCSICGKTRDEQHTLSNKFCNKCTKCNKLIKDNLNTSFVFGGVLLNELHDWNKDCEKCSKCGISRDEQHDWSEDCEKCSKCGKHRYEKHVWINNCEKCSKCGKIEMHHDWSDDCKKCSKCGKTRDEQHDWSENCEKCSKCRTTKENQHDWKGCKCSKCSFIRDEQHNWNGSDCDKCNVCGTTKHSFERLFNIIRNSSPTHRNSECCYCHKTPKIEDWLINLRIIENIPISQDLSNKNDIQLIKSTFQNAASYSEESIEYSHIKDFPTKLWISTSDNSDSDPGMLIWSRTFWYVCRTGEDEYTIWGESRKGEIQNYW
ncbi:MAG: hypothetical protein ACOYOT_08820 [Bacteroidales bacterium]